MQGDLTLIAGSWLGLAAKPSPLFSVWPLQNDAWSILRASWQQPSKVAAPEGPGKCQVLCKCQVSLSIGQSKSHDQCLHQRGRGLHWGGGIPASQGVLGLTAGVETAVWHRPCFAVDHSRAPCVSTHGGPLAASSGPLPHSSAMAASHMPPGSADTRSLGH